MPRSVSESESIEQIRTRIRWLLIGTAFLYVVVGYVSIYAYNTAQTNTDALCAFRADLQDRVQSSQAFLRDHPQGFAGIPAATIKTSLDGQVRTIHVLRDLPC